MGTQKYRNAVEALIQKSPVVSFSSIKRIILSKNKVAQYPKQFVRNMIRQGKMRQLTKGFYTMHDDASLVVFCLQPAYLGLQDAMSHHNLWEQETIPIVITARNVRTGVRTVLGSRVLVRHLQPRYFFGVEHGELPYSDVEKTLIDLVHFKQNIAPEVQRAFRRRVNRKKLKRYLKAYPAQLQATVRRMAGT